MSFSVCTSCPGTVSETSVRTGPDTCLKTCPDACLKTCSYTCLKTCPDVSLKTCSDTCLKTCPDTNLRTYSDTCLKTCPDNYLKPCPDTCLKPCPDTCLKPCPDTYLKTYSDTCLTTCPDNYLKTYSDTCQKPCPDTCLKTCSVTCPKPCPDTCHRNYPEPCSITCPKPCSMTAKSIIIPHHCGLKTPCAPKAYSVYGGGSGGSTRISACTYRQSTCSSCPPYKVGGGHGGFGARIVAGGCERDFDYLQKSEKATMQNLNDRLATYLEKVDSLETSNANLENLIREYYEMKGPICQRDYSCYLNTILCLQEKMKDAKIKNANILLQIDNAKLTADDFRIKFEHESALRQCVEADLANLRCILEKTCLSKADQEAQICALQEELAFMKKKHQEDAAALMCQLSKTVCVEVDVAPQQDLNKVLDEIRCHYETIIDQHRLKQECWFKEKTAELCKDVASSTECMENSRSQIAESKRTLQCLEIELQSQTSLKGALQCSLSDTEAQYGAMLADFQNQINVLEAEVCQLRTGIEQHGKDYATLLDIKSRLEKEIATYRCLMEKQDIRSKGKGGLCTSTHVCTTSGETVVQCEQLL